VDTTAGWGKPKTRRVLSEGVAWEGNHVLGENALYGTRAGSGGGPHPNAGQTRTTAGFTHAWFDRYTPGSSTGRLIGDSQGPMPDGPARSVSGAPFPVPIWHLFMDVAEKGKPVRQFLTPDAYPVYKPFTRGYWGYVATTTTTTTTTTKPKPLTPLEQGVLLIH